MSLSSILVISAVLGISDAFTVPPPSSTLRAPSLTSLQLSGNDGNEPDFVKQTIKMFGVLSLGSILAFNVADASASTFEASDDALCKSRC